MQPTSAGSQSQATGAVRGAVRGLIPLGTLAAIVVLVVLAILLAALGRLIVAGQGFFVQQATAIVVVAAGLLIAAAAYTVACAGTLRRVQRWHEEGSATRANGALWALGAGAFVLLLPVLLAILLPQHPAP